MYLVLVHAGRSVLGGQVLWCLMSWVLREYSFETARNIQTAMTIYESMSFLLCWLHAAAFFQGVFEIWNLKVKFLWTSKFPEWAEKSQLQFPWPPVIQHMENGPWHSMIFHSYRWFARLKWWLSIATYVCQIAVRLQGWAKHKGDVGCLVLSSFGCLTKCF